MSSTTEQATWNGWRHLDDLLDRHAAALRGGLDDRSYRPGQESEQATALIHEHQDEAVSHGVDARRATVAALHAMVADQITQLVAGLSLLNEIDPTTEQTEKAISQILANAVFEQRTEQTALHHLVTNEICSRAEHRAMLAV